MGKHRILVVEDNLLVSAAVKDILVEDGFDAVCAESSKEAAAALAKDQFNLVILDMMLPDANGRDLLPVWQKSFPEMLIVMMTAHGDVPTAVDCLRLGAHDFLTKPVEKPLLLKTVHNALKHLTMAKKVDALTELNKREVQTRQSGDVVANSASMRKTLEMLRLVAGSDFSCMLIKGESGTGKGLLARTVHKMGGRAGKPFVEVNCSALPANLIESELFGHKKGAFTDAKEDKVGLFELADTGTIFLDEIGDMDISLQAKLLKAMEEQKFRRIGGTSDISVNVAIIAATNQNVEQRVKEGKFRLDLYYRLNVIPIEISPLRERPEDIQALSEHFLKFFSRKFGKSLKGFGPAAMQALLSYSWPGNVREFRNVVERGCILTSGEIIDNPEILFPYSSSSLGVHSPSPVVAAPAAPQAAAPLAAAPAAPAAAVLAPAAPSSFDGESFPVMTLAKAEELAIRAALREAKGNRNKAASILGLHRTTLYKKIEDYKIAVQQESAE